MNENLNNKNRHWMTQIMNASKIYIYGAGDMGRALKKCIEDTPFQKKIAAFIVSDIAGNSNCVDDVPVMEIQSLEWNTDDLVLIAVHEKYLYDIMKKVQEYKINNVLTVSFDSDLWGEIRDIWFQKHLDKIVIPYYRLKKDDYGNESLAKSIHIYVVKSAYDKKLKREEYENKYELPIYVGAHYAESKSVNNRDDVGDNISEKNPKYCELTALYWIWRNDFSDIVGLSHYRRKFALCEQELEDFAKSNIDIAVTIPVLNFDGVKQQYAKNHYEKDWNILLEGIQKLCPQYLQSAEEVGQGIYYYAYNMFIARREFVNAYCEWLFPILEYCEQQIGEKEDRYQNRYIGFLAERMLTIFLNYHKQDYKVCIVDKHFLETQN